MPPYLARVSLLCVFSLARLAAAEAPPATGVWTSLTNPKGDKDFRLDRLPALFVPAGTPASPWLAPGPFTATWNGAFQLKERSRLSFSFSGRGSAKLTIGEKVVWEKSGDDLASLGESEMTRLNAGSQPFTLTYTAPATGDAQFRLYWKERAAFPRESVPPTAFAPGDAPAPEVTDRLLAREGRRLFGEHHCSKCHQPDKAFEPGSLPELTQDAPHLLAPGDRYQKEWLAAWLLDPAALKPSARMGQLLHNLPKEDASKAAADIAAFLSTQSIPGFLQAPPAASGPEALALGAHLFGTLGCIGCHTLPSDATPDPEGRRVPLAHVSEKWKDGALAAFLLNPARFHAWTRMPDFGFKPAEAAALAAWLQSESAKAPRPAPASPLPAGDAAKGRELVKSLNCAACHPGAEAPEKNPAPTLATIFKSDWTAKGCAAPADKAGKAPLMHINETDRAALAAFAKAGPASLLRDTAAEFAERQVKTLQCNVCHNRDAGFSLLDGLSPSAAHLIDEKRIVSHVDQSRPQLTYIGEMLQPAYLATVLAGQPDGSTARVRPWLASRMPKFVSRAAALARGLTTQHGVNPAEPAPKPGSDPALATVGQQLAAKDGFSCVTCHAVGKDAAVAAFEVEGVNLSLAKTRLREEYYKRWMWDPARITPATKMTRFTPTEGASSRPELNADIQAQYQALWEWMLK